MKRLIASCFGLGKLPVAPGTWGSAPVAVIFALMCWLGAGVLGTTAVMVGLAVFGCATCVLFAPAAIEATGKKDPREVVVDEVAGQAVTFIGISVVGANQILITAVLGFLLFRVFDIVKPFPARKAEKLPDGWGVLADDLVAGIYAAIVLQICIRLVVAG